MNNDKSQKSKDLEQIIDFIAEVFSIEILEYIEKGEKQNAKQ